jgi:hypothetical protein
MGRERAVLSVGKKKKKKSVCACIEQYTCSSQQNIANYFSLLCGKPITRRFTAISALTSIFVVVRDWRSNGDSLYFNLMSY